MEPGDLKTTQHSQSQALPLSPAAQIKAAVKLKKLQNKQLANEDLLRRAEVHTAFLSLKERAFNDLYTFCVEIMGFTDLYEPLHRPLCEAISNPNSIRKLTLIPRGHFKTTIISICYPAWLLTRDMNERIILSSANASKAQENLREIVQRLLSPEYQKYFGDRIPPQDSWLQNTQDVLWFPRNSRFTGPTIMCLGVDSAEVGRHASRMLIDDMVGKEQVNTKANREKVWGWFGRQLSVLDPNCELNVIGTRWHEDDPYSRLKDNEDWDKIVMKVKEPYPNGPFIFPTRFNEKFLKEIKATQDDYTFSCFYLNEPTGEGINPFDVKKFTFIEYPLPPKKYDKTRSKEDNDKTKAWTYILCDPATTTEDYSCPSGILIVDALSDKRLVIKEAILEKMPPDLLVETLFRLSKIHKPRAVVIEAEAQQLLLHYWLRREMFKRGAHFKVEEVKNPRNKTKPVRLRALQPFLNNGSYVFKKDMPGGEHLVEEFRTYPKGKHDDLICALYMAIPTIQYPPRNTRPDSVKQVPVQSRLLNEMIHRKERAFGRAPRLRLGGKRGHSIKR